MVKAVIFDLDDTLISERKYIESGYWHVAGVLSGQIGVNKQEIYEMLNNLFKENSKNVFNRLLDRYGVLYSKDDIEKLIYEYRNHYPNISFYDDVLPCLRILQQNKIKTGIITDGYAYSQLNKLKAINAFDYFNEILITDELGREYWKPHPKPFEIIREKLNIEFGEMIYIGDNPEKDFYISSIYSIKTIRIYREGIYMNKRYLDDIKEDYSIFNLNELEVIIENNYNIKLR